jgi:predicted DCC family thiol-disulfide oxidoreductase YuxK
MTQPSAPDSPGFDVEIFHDGDCPLCSREVAWLGRLDRRRRIRFVDIAAPDFDASAVGVPWQALMERIHGRLPDGTLIEGVEVFRRAYSAVGLRPLVAFTRLPGLSHALDGGYRWFAQRRLAWTGRCQDGACRVAR